MLPTYAADRPTTSLLRPPPHLVPIGLAALKTVAAARGELNPGARRFLDAAQSVVLGSSHDLDALAPIAPEAVALALDPSPAELRQQLVRAMCLVALVDGPPDPRATALVRDYAAALAVDEPALRPIQRYADGQRLLGWLDFHRRSHLRAMVQETFEGGFFPAIRALFGLRGLMRDPRLAARYIALGELPDGTAGKALYDHYRRHGFGLPGEPNGFPESGVYHDIVHVLGGYDTDAVGELSVGAFCAGFRRQDPLFTALLPLFVFVARINVTPIAHERVDDLFAQPGVAEAYLKAYERGSRVKVDLSDHWDYWPFLGRPIEDVRRDLGIAPQLDV